jgi:hypothetical protein
VSLPLGEAALAANGGNVAAPASKARTLRRLIRSHCQRAVSSAVARCVRLEGGRTRVVGFFAIRGPVKGMNR